MVPDVLVVITPGVAVDGYEALVRALRDAGADPELVALPCAGDAAALADVIARRIRARPAPPVVVAHGIGATLALLAAPEVRVRRYVLLAPVLDGSPVRAALDLALRPVGDAVDLSRPVPWEGHADLRHVLLGERLPPLGCFPAALARDLQAWLGAAAPPIAYPSVGAPVWLGLGLLDEVAPPEVAIPLARRFREVEVVRLGITRLDPKDYDHLGLLLEPAPVRAAVRAAVAVDP